MHAAWNDDCQACHRDFQPLRSDAVSLVGLSRGPEQHRQSLDEACIKCHNTPVHHAAAKDKEVPSCASCHREHQGQAADIVRPADGSCLGCHRNLEQHRNGASGLTPAVANVWGFGLGGKDKSDLGPHPEFRSLTSDPGNIKFNHWLHMQPGLAVADGKRKLKLSDLDEALRAQYAAYAKSGELLQLDCGACHQTEPTSGRTMQPIAFEQHCRACHRLEFTTAAGSRAAGSAARSVEPAIDRGARWSFVLGRAESATAAPAPRG